VITKEIDERRAAKRKPDVAYVEVLSRKLEHGGLPTNAVRIILKRARTLEKCLTFLLQADIKRQTKMYQFSKRGKCL